MTPHVWAPHWQSENNIVLILHRSSALLISVLHSGSLAESVNNLYHFCIYPKLDKVSLVLKTMLYRWHPWNNSKDMDLLYVLVFTCTFFGGQSVGMFQDHPDWTCYQFYKIYVGLIMFCRTRTPLLRRQYRARRFRIESNWTSFVKLNHVRWK